MNWILFVTYFIASLALSCATSCKTAEDCGEGRCCVALSVLAVASKGVCVKLNKKGAHCSEPEAKLDYFGGKFIAKCPCADGLTCRPKSSKAGDTKDLTYFLSLRCQESESTPAPETTISDETATDETMPEEPVTDENIPEETVPDDNVTDEPISEETVSDENDETATDETMPDEPVTDETIPEETVPDEIVTDEPIPEETVPDEIVTYEPIPDETPDDTGNDEIVPDETDEIVPDETDEVVPDEIDEIVPDETGNDEIPADVGAGPGGEPPRDDDCEDWTYGC